MSKQMTDNEIKAEVNAERIDLNQGADAVVPTGDESTPTKVDPFESRKSIFKKATNMRQNRVTAEAAQHEDVAANVEALAREAGQPHGDNELDRGSHIDTNRPDRFDRGTPEHVPDARQVQSSKNDPENGIDKPSGRVTVKVLGETFEVPSDDVDASGGLVAYQKERAASIRLQRAAEEESRIKKMRFELAEEAGTLAEQRARGNAPQGAHAQGAAPTDSGGEGSADAEAQAAALVDDIYSGDPNRARRALQEVMGNRSTPGASIDPADIARQAVQLLKQQDTAAALKPAEPEMSPRLKLEIEELNSMMSESYAEVVNDPTLKARAFEHFQRLRSNPENKYRRLADLGREAAKAVTKHPRQDVVERKRSLPPALTGTYTPPKQEQSEPQSNSDYIARMRQSRGLPA